MPSPSVDTIKFRLSRFERSVDGIILDVKASSGPGTLGASAPYREKCRVRSLLESSVCDGEQYGMLWQDYSRIVTKLERFRDKCGQEYRDLLFSELRNYVQAYHAEVCHAGAGSPCSGHGDGVSTRVLVGELCNELRDHYDLSEIERLVAVLDENAGTVRDVADGMRDDSPVFCCPHSADAGDKTCLCSRRKPPVREP